MSMSGIPEFHNRTLICSVLFIDIVEYSQKPVVEQSRVKERFNALLSEALRGVAINDRIILDTGDGAAISFIGDPEDALFVATTLRDLIESSPHPGSELSTRMGINLGPVRLVKDINGQPNIIGDGINVAQRVMTFAKPGQVLVSRSYYEVVSRLSEESSKLFSYEGARTDKHVREHEVYAVGSVPTPRRRDDAGPGEIDGDRGDSHAPAGPGAQAHDAKRTLFGFARKPAVASLFAVLAIVGVALTARAYLEDMPRQAPPAEVAATKAPHPVAEPAQEPLPPIRGMPPEPARSAAREPPQPSASAPVAKKSSAREKAKGRDKAAPGEDAVREPPRTVSVQEPAAPSAPATLSLAVSPWGEVHVDGKLHGVSPPLQEIEIGPGRHRIEIRNSAAPPHVVTVNAKSGERIRIKHKFE
jgi:class 3 adenylate cyclase